VAGPVGMASMPHGIFRGACGPTTGENHLHTTLVRVAHGGRKPHVERGELGWRITDARHLVGRITWDPDRAGEVPLLVIDGRPFTWNQVGRMLMSFEGFTLRAFVGDSIEVIGGPLLEKEENA
jgi:hypothetical protein